MSTEFDSNTNHGPAEKAPRSRGSESYEPAPYSGNELSEPAQIGQRPIRNPGNGGSY